ncbi:MAG: hypothetical protein FJX74_00220 [Armatimonadetes bacterium]|nr:hypothetical protein [Armatimonadota bacterium]
MADDHGVEYEEAVEALRSAPHLEQATSGPSGQRRYRACGLTSGGRRLEVIVARDQGGWMRIITAFEPRGQKQRRRHRRR